jgi:hypothetical protein
MYYDDCTYRRGKKTYRRQLLRESRRVGGKVAKRTVANITDWPEPIKQAVIQALASGRSGQSLSAMMSGTGKGEIEQGKSIGAVATVLAAAERLGIRAALGDDRQGRLALYQVVARVIDQGSRLSAVRMAGSHAAAELIGLSGFDEDDLYENLSWLSTQQQTVENRLFSFRYPNGQSPALFLYDVTSSYFEGVCNELAAFGYNRDGKKGKLQVVVGMLTDHEGDPLSIEVFPGNTADPTTVSSQVAKLRERFRGNELTMVGDRGMLKGPQKKELLSEAMHYLTAITKAQIEGLVRLGVVQMELFEEQIAEVTDPQTHTRYILRRNPAQAARIAARRADQLRSWQAALEQANRYLEEHPKAEPETALRKLTRRAERLKLSGWLQARVDGRTLGAVIDEKSRTEAARLDGCYALHTDLPATVADADTLDARYHDLSKVEWAFRTSKTVHLEMRPIHLRREDRTRAHAFVVMLAYKIIRCLASCWHDLDCTVEEGLMELAQLCSVSIHFPDGTTLQETPRPRPSAASLLSAAGVDLPTISPLKPPRVVTKTKLTSRRK